MSKGIEVVIDPLKKVADGYIKEPILKVADGFVKMGKDVEHNFRRFGDNIRDTVENMRSDTVNTNHSSKIWVANSYDHLGIFQIRSLRKLLDIVERKYSFVSIVLLLINMAMEATAVGIYMRVQHTDAMSNHLDFDWGLGNFITLGIFSIFFTISWIGLLIVDDKKFNFLFRPSSIMFYFSAVWMLVLSVMAMVDSKFTHAYVPMFLRLWWLHECILVLLDYPQISSFFKEDRLAMLRALVQCFAVIGICVGIYQAVEGYYGTNPLDYFTTTYFMMVVFSSVGYGDILISTALSRFLLIVLMMVGAAYFVPLLDYIANLGVKHLNYKTYTRWFKRTDHVIIAGKFERNDLRLQLDNIFAGKRCYLQLHVVVMLDDQPDPGILVLLNAPKYRSSVTLLVGDPGNETDLDRCNARGASAIFLFGKGVNSSYYSDYDTAKQATTISNYVRKVPLFVFLHRSRYTRSMIPPGVCILEVERMNQILLGLGAVLPGMLPLVGNLIRQFDPMSQFQVWNSTDFENPKKGAIAVARAVRNIGAKQREMFSYGNFFGENENASGDATVNIEDDINWKHIYEASMAQQIIVLPMPEEQKGRSFRSMAHFLFKQGVTLIGAVRKIEGTETTYIDIACSGKLVDAVKLIVISDKEKAVLSAFETLPPVVEGNVRDTLGFDDPRSFTALRDLVESELGLAGGSFAFSPASINQSFAEMHNIHLTPNVDNRNSFDSVVVAEGVTHEEPVKESYKPADGVAIVSGSEEGEPLLREEGGLGEPRTSASDVPSREMTAEIMAESLQKLSQDPQFMKKVTSLRNVTSPHPSHLTPEIAPAAIVFAENASHLTNHIVFVELSSGLEVTSWSSEARVESFTTKVTDMFDALHPVRQHSPLVNIVLLANEDDYTFLQTMWEQESHGILTIVQGCGLVYEDLRKCNFQEAASVVVFCAGERNDPQGDIMSVLTAKSIRELCQSEIPIVVELDETWHTHLLSRNSFPGSSLNYTTEPSFMSGTVVCRHMLDTCLQESFFTPELMGVLEQILAGRQDALMVTSLQCKAGWATYMDVVDYCLDRRLLPLGIHRRHTEDRGEGERQAVFRYMITNPPAMFPVCIDDVFYCIKVRIVKR